MKIEATKGATLEALADINRNKVGQLVSGNGQIPYSVLYTIIHKTLGVAITYDDWLKYIQNYLIVNNPELKNHT